MSQAKGQFKVDDEFVSRLNSFLRHGVVCETKGEKGVKGGMCSQALVSYLMNDGRLLNDTPSCVEKSINNMVIRFNDVYLSDNLYNALGKKSFKSDSAKKARAMDIKPMLIAQLGSDHLTISGGVVTSVAMHHVLNVIGFKGVCQYYLEKSMVGDKEFCNKVIERCSGIEDMVVELFKLKDKNRINKEQYKDNEIEAHEVRESKKITTATNELVDFLNQRVGGLWKKYKRNPTNNTFESQLAYCDWYYKEHYIPYFKIVESIFPIYSAFDRCNKESFEIISEFYYPLIKLLINDYVEFFKKLNTEGSKYL